VALLLPLPVSCGPQHLLVLLLHLLLLLLPAAVL
jgi:hypothetical protein